jgi:acetyltransferase-like isoleucine patch superfamily enzyme
MNFRHVLVTSDHSIARAIRGLARLRSLTLPVPHPLCRILLAVFLVFRGIYYWCFRVLIAEPLFKGYCQSYGRNVRTDVFVHWIQGRGDLIIGDDVLVDGKCSFNFAARFTEHPTLLVGSGTGIGHGCVFTIGKRITIGRNCRIAAGVWMFDSPGHPSDPGARINNSPPSESDVRPIAIADNVWIGGHAVIFPGVTIGEGSIISAAAVVTADVPANAIVAGNPARRIGMLATTSAETK